MSEPPRPPTPFAARPASDWSDARVEGLYDFSLDIRRHQDDQYFADNDGRIHYVFDENIFEMFVHPFQECEAVQRDPGPRPTDSPEVENARKVQAAQCALYTSEILFGGALPGQVGGRIYLTDWHRWELLTRMNALLAEYASSGAGAFRTNASSILKHKRRAFAKANHGAFDLASFKADPLLAEDIAALQARLELDEASLTLFALTRDVAAVLSMDKAVEPPQQLGRLLAPETQSRLRGLVTLRRPPAAAMDELKRQTGRWARALKAEVNARAARHGAKQKKGGQAIWNDAQSLALVEWVSRQLDPRSERVVFVTSDQSVFDAYRRVLEENISSARGRTKPFLLRRPLQYSPLFLTDEDTPLGSHEVLLYSAQQAAELALIPLRLAAITEEDVSLEVLYRRHSLTLTPDTEDLKYAPTFLGAFWRKHRSAAKERRLTGVDHDLNFTERTLGGFLPYLVNNRTNAEEKKLFEDAALGNEADQDILFGAYIDNAVEKLVVRTVEIWRPIAMKFLEETISNQRGKPRRAVPVAVQIALSRKGTSVDLVGFLNALLNPANTGAPAPRPASFLSTSFDLFAACGAAALIANQWRQADHFCDVAINAFSYFEKHDHIPRTHAVEAHYLAALAKRFRIGDLIVSQNRDAFASARSLFDDAMTSLKMSEELDAKSEAAAENFVAYRFHSERAALCLFFAELCSSQSRALEGVPEIGDIAQAGRLAFEQATESLLACVEAERHSRRQRTIIPKEGGSPQELLRMQLLVNIAALYALKPLTGVETDPDTLLAEECKRSLDDLLRALDPGRHPLFAAELRAYMISQGIAVEESREALQNLRDTRPTLELEIDRRLFQAVTAHWLS